MPGADEPPGGGKAAGPGGGTAALQPKAEPEEAPAAGGRRSPLVALGAGWPAALGGAVLTALVLGLLAEVPVFLAWIGRSRRPSLLPTAKLGGLLFYSFHDVAIVIRGPRLRLAPGGPLVLPSGVATVQLALLTGTVLLGLSLVRTGRAIGSRIEGPGWLRGLHGTKVALPYALIAFAGSFGASLPLRLAGMGSLGGVTLAPSHLAAFVWPLGLGVLFGFAGGASAVGAARVDGGGSAEPAGKWGRRVRAAAAGGWSMQALGLALSFASLLGLAAVKHRAAGSYFRAISSGGFLHGAAVAWLNALAIPNMAAWILYPAMGGCLRVAGGASSFCALSWTSFPSRAPTLTALAGGAGVPRFPQPPAVYFGFVAVPVLAVLIGGATAARRAGARGPGEAAGVGALAGVAFALFSLVVLALATLRVDLGQAAMAASGGAGRLQAGPAVFMGALLALVWGVVGGAIGGLVGGSGSPPEPGRAR